MGAQRFVAVVGARALPESFASQVAEVVRCFTARGWGIGSGGARGADQFALAAVIATGRSACARSTVFLPGAVGGARKASLHTFAQLGGRVVAGSGAGRAALLGRSRRLVRASSGVVAFLWGPSRGSVFTVREAITAGKPVAVVLAGGGAGLPSFQGGRWVPCSVGTVAAFRWVPSPQGSEEPRCNALHRIFVVPDGEPTHALMQHVSSLTQGERLWWEQGMLAGDTVVVPHEALSDTPSFLAVPRLRRRFRCTVCEAAGLAELFLALEASPAVVRHYEAEARQRGVALVIEDLVHLVARLELGAQCPDSDALEDADCLAEAAEQVSTDGTLSRSTESEEVLATLGWHALGSVQPESVACPECGATYDVDDESTDTPACPECATPHTWEARQGPAFRQLMADIDGCPTLGALGEQGRQLYARRLTPEQASVAWSHFQLRKAALEAAITLSASARALVSQVEQAPACALPRLGAKLYRLQHRHAVAVAPGEWRRIWGAYQRRRTVARPA